MSDDRKKPREVETMADEVSRQPSQRRRRLVKGALSAPVFLTLQNGSVFANTSNDATVATSADEAVSYPEGAEVQNILCVEPVSTVEWENNNRADFGTLYECHDIAYDPKVAGAKEDAFLHCTTRENGGYGGYIIAGSSHASICH